MSPGLAPLSVPWWTLPDVPVDIQAPSLEEQVCFYGLCLPTSDHADWCETYTPLQVAASRLHWKLKLRRDER